ncbi:phosphonate transporter [Variovorax sp. RHLX14]|uniref:phosphonate transporter n=1 Tax=Variovorax sp. RHLX14 TaxID=1259731 RepID=UPI003F47BF56
MTDIPTIPFEHEDLLAELERAPDSEVDTFQFGVIGFDAETVVRRYSAFESKMSGLSVSKVVGYPLFTIVAPCMNNFLVAQRFEDAAASGTGLDEVLDYVLTLRMRPIKVKLRLLAGTASGLRYVLIKRPA